jgi:large subunit ribosomal protein L2
MRKLVRILSKKSGRGFRGQLSVRHQGGRVKRFLREIDFGREKREVWGRVERIEYDPNRNANIALVVYEDGERRYILASLGLKEGQKIISSEDAPIEVGNALPLKKIPVGIAIHNLEIKPGKGAQLVRSAGNAATMQAIEKDYALVKLPSGEIRKFDLDCFASIGQVGNIEARTVRLGKAGRKRKMGIRPTVRGTAMHPAAHPHGGGEGRSSIGLKYPKTPYGKKAVGKTRKKKKYSDKLIVQGRKRKR